MRKVAGSGMALAVLVSTALTFAQSQADTTAQEPTFRAPFVLKLRIDNERYYEQHFDRIPYVEGNDVYLFTGENFGINVTTTGNQISRMIYQRDPAKGDVEFNFTQEKSASGPMMMLVTRNRLKRRLFFDALMTVPEKKELYKMSVLPVEPRLSNYESWPHPIVQLVLRNFRFTESGSNSAPQPSIKPF